MFYKRSNTFAFYWKHVFVVFNANDGVFNT